MATVDISHPNHNSLLFENLQDFAVNENFTDICFVCANGIKIYSHKLLVCSVSDEIKKMVMDMPPTNDMIVVHIPDLLGSTVNLVVNFLYNGSMRLCREQYKDFQDTLKLLGIVLTTSIDNDQTPQQPVQPPLIVQNQTPQQPVVYQATVPTLIQDQIQQQPVYQPTPTASTVAQPQAEQQFMYVSPGQNNTQGIQYILPEQTQYTAIAQPGNGILPVQEAIQGSGQTVGVCPQQIVQVVPSRNAVQSRNQIVASDQVVVRNNNSAVVLSNEVHRGNARHRFGVPNSRQPYQIAQRNNQVVQSPQGNTQFRVANAGAARGNIQNSYVATNQQSLQNNTSHLQNIMTQQRTNPNIGVQRHDQLVARRRRRLQAQQSQPIQPQLQGQSQLQPPLQQLQIQGANVPAKRPRNST